MKENPKSQQDTDVTKECRTILKVHKIPKFQSDEILKVRELLTKQSNEGGS